MYFTKNCMDPHRASASSLASVCFYGYVSLSVVDHIQIHSMLTLAVEITLYVDIQYNATLANMLIHYLWQKNKSEAEISVPSLSPSPEMQTRPGGRIQTQINDTLHHYALCRRLVFIEAVGGKLLWLLGNKTNGKRSVWFYIFQMISCITNNYWWSHWP